MSSDSYRGVKLLQNNMKITEKVLKEELQILVSFHKVRFMPEKGAMDALCIVQKVARTSSERQKKNNTYVLLVWKRHLTEYQKE